MKTVAKYRVPTSDNCKASMQRCFGASISKSSFNGDSTRDSINYMCAETFDQFTQFRIEV